MEGTAMMSLAERERAQMIAEFQAHRYCYPECKYGELPTIKGNEAGQPRKGCRSKGKPGLEAKATVAYR
jgi:hypothetical protein